MASIVFLVATLLASVSGFVLPDHQSPRSLPSPARHVGHLSRRNPAGPSYKPVQQEIDFKTRLPGRQILVGDGRLVLEISPHSLC